MLKAKRLICGIVWMSMMGYAGCQSHISPTPSPSETPAAAAALPTQNATTVPTQAPSPTPTTRSTNTPTPTTIPTWVGPDKFPEGFNPFTGLALEDPSRLDRRPVLIKVSNYPASLRPHAGLSLADLVWEYSIGEGMTRFLALYYGQDSAQVGPVRSGRLIDSHVVRMYGGFLGMAGADKFVWSQISDELPGRILSVRPATCPALCRTGSGDVNSVFADTGAFTAYVAEQGMDNSRPELSGMFFDLKSPEDGERTDSLWIYYSYYDQVGWDYSPSAGVYLRSQEEVQEDGTVKLVPMTDRLTESQLAFENVVILFAWHEELKPTLIDIDLWDVEEQRAIILRDGYLYEVLYSAVSRDSPLRFYDQEGEPFPFKQGSTWFEVVGMGSTVAEISEGDWKIRFYP